MLLTELIQKLQKIQSESIVDVETGITGVNYEKSRGHVLGLKGIDILSFDSGTIKEALISLKKAEEKAGDAAEELSKFSNILF